MIKFFDSDHFRQPQKVAKDLLDAINKFKVKLPFLLAFSSEAVLPRHWDNLFTRMEQPPRTDHDKITMEQMLDMNGVSALL